MLKVKPVREDPSSEGQQPDVSIGSSGFSEEELEDICKDIEYYNEHPDELKQYSDLNELFRHWFNK